MKQKSNLTIEGKKALKRELKVMRVIFIRLKDLEQQWETLSKASCFNSFFWKIDKEVMAIYKYLRTRPFSTYPIRVLDELMGYIEHLEGELDG